MRFFFISVLLSMTATVFSQNAFKITYDYSPAAADNRKLMLVFNDSLQYGYISIKNYGPKKNAIVFGKTIVHHSNYHFTAKDVTYSMMGMDKQHPYLFTVESDKRVWKNTADRKKILGYDCGAMLSVNANGDSAFIYYTKDLGMSASPLFSYNVDGVVLEVFDQAGGLFHVEAVKIEKGNFEISFPGEMEVVTGAERNRRVFATRPE